MASNLCGTQNSIVLLKFFNSSKHSPQFILPCE